MRDKKRLCVTEVRRAQAEGDASIKDIELPPLDDHAGASRPTAS